MGPQQTPNVIQDEQTQAGPWNVNLPRMRHAVRHPMAQCAMPAAKIRILHVRKEHTALPSFGKALSVTPPIPFHEAPCPIAPSPAGKAIITKYVLRLDGTSAQPRTEKGYLEHNRTAGCCPGLRATRREVKTHGKLCYPRIQYA